MQLDQYREVNPDGSFCWTWEAISLAHRYLYYVEGAAVLSDDRYDLFERLARAEAPASSPIHGVGSSNPWDYPEEIRWLASQFSKLYVPESISPTHSRKNQSTKRKPK